MKFTFLFLNLAKLHIYIPKKIDYHHLVFLLNFPIIRKLRKQWLHWEEVCWHWLIAINQLCTNIFMVLDFNHAGKTEWSQNNWWYHDATASSIWRKWTSSPPSIFNFTRAGSEARLWSINKQKEERLSIRGGDGSDDVHDDMSMIMKLGTLIYSAGQSGKTYDRN